MGSVFSVAKMIFTHLFRHSHINNQLAGVNPNIFHSPRIMR